MRVYLDNCCFNRPFDDQQQARIRLETEAKLMLQEMIRIGELELAWSYILDFENRANPFDERKTAIEKWKNYSVIDIEENDELLTKANAFHVMGFAPQDALHLACALVTGCEYFVTTDDFILKRATKVTGIRLVDPTFLVREIDR